MKRRLSPKPALLTSRSTGRDSSVSRSSTRAIPVRSERSATSTSLCAAWSGRQLVGQRLQPFVVARDQHEVVAALGETEREDAPDPGGGAGDESDGAGGASMTCGTANPGMPTRGKSVRHDGPR